MGSIAIRKHASGTETYRVFLTKKGYKRFTLSFKNYDEACQWLEENELEFVKDPNRFYKWKEDEYLRIRREKLNGAPSTFRIRNRISPNFGEK